jgi:endo-alpha-1,4-polygalactosaminidase (GH114 family)
LETRVSIEVYTDINGSHDTAKRKAKEIKEKVNQIMASNSSIKTSKDHYFIYVYGQNGEDLIDEPFNEALEPQINSFGKKADR